MTCTLVELKIKHKGSVECLNQNCYSLGWLVTTFTKRDHAIYVMELRENLKKNMHFLMHCYPNDLSSNIYS